MCVKNDNLDKAWFNKIEQGFEKDRLQFGAMDEGKALFFFEVIFHVKINGEDLNCKIQRYAQSCKDADDK